MAASPQQGILHVVASLSSADDASVAALNALSRGGVNVTICGSNADIDNGLWVPSVRHVQDALHTHLVYVRHTNHVGTSLHDIIHRTLEGHQPTTAVFTHSPAEASISTSARFATLLLGTQSPRDLLRIVPQSFFGPHSDVTLVGYMFKATREVKLGELGMLPCTPRDGVAFLPVDLNLPLEAQLPFDVLLHKASDVALPGTADNCIPTFGEDMLRLERFAAQHGIPFVDPLASLRKHVMDRASLCKTLLGLQHIATETPTRVRGGPFIEVSSLLDVADTLAAAGMRLPAIVKPRVACGQEHSHRMALLLRPGGCTSLQVPLPAVASEFVDHDAVVHKVYVLGSEVYCVQRQSVPNLAALLKDSNEGALPDCINFDSLKNDFAAMFDGPEYGVQQQRPGALDMQAVGVTAAWLRSHLELHLFGFDVCVERGTGDHVVVDVNYFPSCSNVADAPRALRAALKMASRTAGDEKKHGLTCEK